jgi:hypothetical protein
MRWLAKLLGVPSVTPLLGASLVVVFTVGGMGGYKIGNAFGYKAGFSAGEDAQKARQQAADAIHRADVERKVRNALDEIGIDPSSSDAERILLDLRGSNAAE